MERIWNPRRNDKGAALLLSLGVLMIIVIVGAALLLRSNTDQKLQKRAKDRVDIRYGAEAGINRGLLKLVSAIEAESEDGINPGILNLNQIPFEFPDETAKKDSGDYLVQGPTGHQRFTFKSEDEGHRLTYQVMDVNFNPATNSSSWNSEPGANVIWKNFIVQAEAVNLSNGSREVLETQYQIQRRPFGTFSMFFNGDVQFYPKNAMYYEGDVHVNGDLKLRGPDPLYVTSFHSDGVGSLRFNGNVTASGFIDTFSAWGRDTIVEINASLDPNSPPVYRNFVNGDGTIRALSGSHDDAIYDAQLPRNEGVNWEKKELNDKWNGRVRAYEPPSEIPPYDTFLLNGYYADKAGLVIQRVEPGSDGDDDGNGYIIENRDGKSGCEAALLADPDPSSASSGPIVSEDKEFVNGREYVRELDASGTPISVIQDGRVTVTDVDFSALTNHECFPQNKLIYFTDRRAVPDETPDNFEFDIMEEGGRRPNGLRLHNGDELYSSALMVTDNPLYVKGHFNRKPAPGHCSFGDADGFCPVGLIGDSITVLSEAWSDENQQEFVNGGGNPAAPTEVVAAIIAGNRTGVDQIDEDGNVLRSDGSNSSSSVRMLENWDSVEFTFKGSLAFLWQSRYLTAPWRWSHDRYYVGAKRNWKFDDRLKKLDLLSRFHPEFLLWQPSRREYYGIAHGLMRKIQELTALPTVVATP